MFSTSLAFDNNHDYSEDDGDDDFHTSGGTSNGNNYEDPENRIDCYSATEYPINESVSYFMGLFPICSNNHMAVETVYMLEAYTIMRSAKMMKKPDVALKVQAMYEKFINVILRGFPRKGEQCRRVVDKGGGLAPEGQGHGNKIEGNWYSTS